MAGQVSSSTLPLSPSPSSGDEAGTFHSNVCAGAGDDDDRHRAARKPHLRFPMPTPAKALVRETRVRVRGRVWRVEKTERVCS
ncbi:hypothetical protein L484_000263 [Morus notabilis]|uniref:Uncharacterized protein n=1 Tax=Morus notabilis TaxID=981085 RepID=W9SDN5_9ROSA|nr:hypothetical protein L484_000263 [Morus notabilis]